MSKPAPAKGDAVDAEQYLDSSAYIRKLDEAEQAHQLDGEGVLEKLTEAAGKCQIGGEHHRGKADAYMLAQGAYYAEIKRRTVASPSESGKRGAAVRDGRAHLNDSPLGFQGWCRTNDISWVYARKLAQIGESADPVATLGELRLYHNKYTKDAHRRTSVLAKAQKADLAAAHADPLAIFKREFRKFSPVQRVAAWKWINEQFESTLQAAAD